MATPEIAHSDWEPTFIDYLYVSFTNATAFSPTDTMPLSRWAKTLMAVQSAVAGLSQPAAASAQPFGDSGGYARGSNGPSGQPDSGKNDEGEVVEGEFKEA